MAITLQKGQTINLEKSQYDLSQITVGLGWHVRKEEPKGFFKSLRRAGRDEDYDLDAIAFLLNKNNKVGNLGSDRLVGGDVVFFNSLKHPSGTIWLTGDNRVGGQGDDDEQIIVKLESMSPNVERILFLVTIYQGRQKGQHFGMVENAFIRAVDASGKEMTRFNISSEPSFNNKCAVIFAEVYRKDGGWKFRAIGDPKDTDNFVDILRQYM
ncbi:MAG TPA: TerD family protein [bacterium]|nr:TerD family protein [bacterium]